MLIVEVRYVHCGSHELMLFADNNDHINRTALLAILLLFLFEFLGLNQRIFYVYFAFSIELNLWFIIISCSVFLVSISRYDEVKDLILSVMYELIRLLSACLRTFDNFNDISLSGYLSPLFFPNSFFFKRNYAF